MNTFAQILFSIMLEKHVNTKEFRKEMYESGIDITYASLYSYYKGTVIPPHNVAREILEYSGLQFSNNELDEILEYSKTIARSEREDTGKVLNLNLKIKPQLIDKKYKRNPQELRSVLEMRADELFSENDELITSFSAGGKRKLSAYVAYLIKKDLKENGFIEEDR